MGVYFGTDGLRGVFNKELTFDLAYSCGNALAKEFDNIKILIGRDTRSTGSFLTLAFSCGAMQAGASVVDVGVCPTAGISYLTKKFGFDYGVVISASHNPSKFNGIKIFDKFGIKLNEEKEETLEKQFFIKKFVNYKNIGTYKFNPKLLNVYIDFLLNSFNFSFNGEKVVIDCSNGSYSNIAKRIFEKKGAKVIAISVNPNGRNINKNCGCVFIQNLQNEVIKNNARFGFAFDGDGDRCIAVDENGEIVDGDKLLYIFALYFKKINKLSNNLIVGTKHTNMGVEIALKNKGINLFRAEIGDKFVGQKVREYGALLGGEQSGHIIINSMLETGDGLLTALCLSFICMAESKNLSKFIDFELFKQVNKNVFVKDKDLLMRNKILLEKLKEKQKELLGVGRIMVRASGTEPCVRVMVETQNEEVSMKIANEFVEMIQQLDENLKKCVE